MKEVVEMLYLTEEPLTLSGAKYEKWIGPIIATPFEEGITATVKALQQANTAASVQASQTADSRIV